MKNHAGESGEYWYAYHAYHANGLLPHEYSALPKKEKAIIMAFVQIRQEEEEKQAKKAKKK